MNAWATMTLISRQINTLIVKAILAIFYFTILGVIAVLYQLTHWPKTKMKSYWVDPVNEIHTEEYLRSPY